MSLEQAIQDLTAEIRILNAANATGQPASGPSDKLAPKDGRTRRNAPGAGAQLSTVPNPAAMEKVKLNDLQKDALASRGTDRDPEKYDYDKHIKPLLMKIVASSDDETLGRQELTALLQRFGVAKAPDLSPGQYPMVFELANDIITKKLSVQDAAIEEESLV